MDGTGREREVPWRSLPHQKSLFFHSYSPPPPTHHPFFTLHPHPSISTSIFDTLTVVYYMKYASGHGRSPFWRPLTAVLEGATAAAADGKRAGSVVVDAAALYGPDDLEPKAQQQADPLPKHGNETTAPPTTTPAPGPTTPPPSPTPTAAPTPAAAQASGHFPNWGLRDGLTFVHALKGLHEDHGEGDHPHRRRLLGSAAPKHGGTDGHGNPVFPLPPGGDGAVPPDPSWFPYLPTPASPEFPSDHAAAAAAAAWVLATWFDEETANFTVWGDAALVADAAAALADDGTPLPRHAGESGLTPLFPVGAAVTFPDAGFAAGDAAASRVWAGVNFPHTVLDSLELGRVVAEFAWDGFTANIRLPDPPPPPTTAPPQPTVAPVVTLVPGSKAAVSAAVHAAKVSIAAAEEEAAGMVDGWKDKVDALTLG